MCGVGCLFLSGCLFIYSSFVSPAVEYVRAWAATKPAAPTPTPGLTASSGKPVASPKPARQPTSEPVKPKTVPKPASSPEQTLIAQAQPEQDRYLPPRKLPTPTPEPRALTYDQCKSRIEYKELIASAPIPPECQRQYDQYMVNKRDEAERRERDAAQRKQEAEQLRREREQREDAERRERNQKIEDGVRDLKGLIPRLKRRP
jgi:hypothetical protein